MSEWAVKRFWTTAEVLPEGDDWRVTLDGRPVRTPSKAPLAVPTEALAKAIAEEWRAQAEVVDPTTMPYTRMANSAIDKVTPQFDDVVAYLAAYGETDLLCYRAESPATLAERQRAYWDPLLDWAQSAYAARLLPTAGLMPVVQSPEALARLEAALRAHSAFELAALHDLIALSGSLIVGLAASRDFQPPEALYALSRLDESFQIEQWGEDDEASTANAKRLADFLHAAEFFRIAQKSDT